MNIVNPYRFGIISSNVFIGGVGATSVTSAADFVALTTGITTANISNFEIDEFDNVSFYCNADYSLIGSAFLNDSDITYFIDVEHCTSLATSNNFRNCENLVMVELGIATTCGTDVFIISNNLASIYIPLITPIGASGSTNSGCFNSVYIYGRLFCKSTLATINAGSPDPDIADAVSAGYLDHVGYITDTTAPTSISDLTVDDFGGASIFVSWTAPSFTNTFNHYQIFVNGAFWGITTDVSYSVSRLSLNTSYTITVKAVDEFYNRSTSNAVTQTTASAYDVPTGNIISYWNFDSDSLDQVGANDGTDTSMSYVSSGGIGNVANFTAGTSSKITLADSDTLSFGNGTTDSAFSIIFNVKFNSVSPTIQYFINKFNATSTIQEYLFFRNGDSFIVNLRDDSVPAVLRITYGTTISTGVWYNIIFTYDGSSTQSGLKLYLNSISGGTTGISGTYIAMENSANAVSIGKHPTATSVSFNGYMDETAIFDKELSAIEVAEIYSKNQAGLFLTE